MVDRLWPRLIGSFRPLLVAALALGAAAVSGATPAGAVAGFGDTMPDRFYTDAVQWMVDEEITGGVTDECFAPDEAVTRGEAAVFLWRMEGEQAPAGGHGFTDVPGWMSDAVAWMVEQEITLGTTPSTFSPNRVLNRGEFAAFMWRLEGTPPAVPHEFVDVPGWLDGAVSWMATSGVTRGTTDTTFSPGDTVTRGQVATFLYRYRGSPAVTVDDSSPRCDRVSNFVGTWESIDSGDGSFITMSIDASGVLNGYDNATLLCGNYGHPGAAARWSTIGAETTPDRFVETASLSRFCLPSGQPPVPAGSSRLGFFLYLPLSDTLVADYGDCFWRAGSTSADCP